MYHYGYYVKLADGRFKLSGNDWSQTLDSYKEGDSLGIKGSVEGIVVGVIKGEEAQRNRFDVMILLEQRSVSTGQIVAPHEPRLVTRPQIQADFQGQKVRAVGNKIHLRPANESFHDFQVHHLLWQLGRDWFDKEMAKPMEERHVILKWRHERSEQFVKYRKPGQDPNLPVTAPVTGGGKALQVLADDIYQLAHALDTPKRIISRLKDAHEFQGARFEILVASLIARCGFSIQFIDDTSKRNPEFLATKDGECIAVEAKSRHRSGVLHERGAYRENAPAEIKRLYETALGQNPGRLPFLVFIDVNLPLSPEVPIMEKEWVKEAMQTFEHRRKEEREDSDTALVLTNFGWHFSRDARTRSGEYITVLAGKPNYPIRSQTLQLLERALSEYGLVVDEEECERRSRDG